MRRIAWASLIVGLLWAATASLASQGSRVRVTVHPASGLPRTRFVVSFRAPVAAGVRGEQSRSYHIAASGPSGRACVSSASSLVRGTSAGQRVRVTLAPAGRFHAWCVGSYQGSLTEFVSPSCDPGRACPQFIAVLPLGRFKFHVR